MTARSVVRCVMLFFLFFNDTATTEIYTLSLHDALPISGHENAGLRIIAVRQRNARVGRNAGCRCNTGHYLKRNVVSGESFYFFAAPAKDKRVTPLEPQHAPALPGQAHQQLLD